MTETPDARAPAPLEAPAGWERTAAKCLVAAVFGGSAVALVTLNSAAEQLQALSNLALAAIALAILSRRST